MTLQTFLQFGDVSTGNFNKVYQIVSYHSGYSRAHNAFNPQTCAKCNDVYVTIIAPSKEDLWLYEWYIENTKLSGRLYFEIMDAQANSETIERSIIFEDAQCVSLKETYDINRKRRRQLTLCFTPANINVEGTDFCREGESTDTNTSDNVDMTKYNSQYDF